MKRLALALIAAACLAAAAPKKPGLVLTVVIDQFRYDYLTRFRAEYKGGFERLLTGGAVFTSASYIHMPTITAPGHATILSGALPSVSGIIANDWFDREENAPVTSVSDKSTRLLGGSPGATGSSPNRLLVSTIADELKIASPKSHTIGVSYKDRAAILPVGRTADAAYWFDTKSGSFVSSSFYFDALPAWAKEFDAPHAADKYKGAAWLNHRTPADSTLYTKLEATPFANELVAAFAERALAAEKLGTHEGTDLLLVSFSGNDYIGHDYGYESPEAHEISLLTDRLLDHLFQAAERQAGAGNVLVVLTADHGAAPLPEANWARRMPGGRFLTRNLRKVVQTELEQRHGAGDWVWGNWDLSVYLDQKLIAEKGLDLATVRREAAQALAALPHIVRTYTFDDLVQGRAIPDDITRRVANGFHTRRGPDVILIPEPYWVVRTNDDGTSHGSPYSFDSHVPVIFMGAGIRPGTYYQPVIVNDIAPTLAAILQIEPPGGSMGRVLSEIFE
jgi:predicted AlkP superfamily pyrophosphatase or phosphodiesterase